MSESLAQTVALYAAGLAVCSLATALRGRGIGRLHAAGAVVLGAGAALDALIAAAAVATGARPAEPVPFWAHLLLSVLAVPVGWRYARAASRGWDAAALALATAALGVICGRTSDVATASSVGPHGRRAGLAAPRPPTGRGGDDDRATVSHS